MKSQDTQLTPTPIVEFRQIAKTYDGIVNVIEGLNLDIRPGEFVTLLGPSGSGKTTLLMMLAGFENPTEGEVVLNGQRLNSIPAYQRNMGVVFQSYALFPHMSVHENVAYPLKQRKFSKADIADRVQTALDKVDMVEFANRHPTQLSGGQQQRIALARALVFEPDVVLMDEPLGALDKQLREQMQIEIKRLHDVMGMTVLYVTHDQSEALTMSDRIAIFNHGDILQVGSPHEVYEHPNCSFVANFIGEINNFPGELLTVFADGSAQVSLDCGLVITGENLTSAGAGDRVNLAVRPERMVIRATERSSTAIGRNVSELASDNSEANAVHGTITNRIYYGNHIRYQLDVVGAVDVIAQANLSEQITHQKGAAVTLSWQPECARILDAR